jgi:hypothetical protein
MPLLEIPDKAEAQGENTSRPRSQIPKAKPISSNNLGHSLSSTLITTENGSKPSFFLRLFISLANYLN